MVPSAGPPKHEPRAAAGPWLVIEVTHTMLPHCGSPSEEGADKVVFKSIPALELQYCHKTPKLLL